VSLKKTGTRDRERDLFSQEERGHQIREKTVKMKGKTSFMRRLPRWPLAGSVQGDVGQPSEVKKGRQRNER